MSDLEAALAALVKDTTRLDTEIRRVHSHMVGVLVMAMLSLVLTIFQLFWR